MKNKENKSKENSTPSKTKVKQFKMGEDECKEPMEILYQGKILLCLPTGNPKFPFIFGMGKAKAILKNIKDIKLYVQNNSQTDENDS
jgi:hypothetical protein